MNKEQAKEIVQKTFGDSFNINRFTFFIENLLNKIEKSRFNYNITRIPDAFKKYITKYERIGKYNDGSNRIDILAVYLSNNTSMERARTMQRNFVAGYLNGKYGSDKIKDAALVAFISSNNEDWRFSLVKMDHQIKDGKVSEEFTSARRWSFLVGKNENSHTAQSQLVPIMADDENNPTLAELEGAFNIEKVTKEFFEKYRELFLGTKEKLEKVVNENKKIKSDFETKGVNTIDFAKKLLGQIVFLYFLQKKGWFGVKRDAEWGTGPKNFLRELFAQKHGNYNNFFNDILEPLFYEALARERDDNFYSRFNCKIPFLNGGLFDPINNYDWVHTDIFLSNDLFSNTYKTKEGDTGNGILDIFDRYNFTVKEDEPLEKEVAVDPEMLGKVFENLLEVKDRKSKGTYYTPREIVHYMCQQSLINYLEAELNQGTIAYEKFGKQQLDIVGNDEKDGQLDLTIKHKSGLFIKKQDIETLIKHGELVSENETTVKTKGRETADYFYKLPESIRQNANIIDEKLANIKVCDPAIGSGAFPVGMMSEIVKTRNVLSSYIKGKDRTIYNFKRKCIEKSLYGVDIDLGAVEIAKLRLWLSLVVDEDDIKDIKPLPNLDYKIVCGNSLLGVEKNLFNQELFNELEKLKPLLFNETDPKKKQKYKKQIDDLISQITSGHKEFDFEVYFSEVFHEKKGFDVVIANPPYIRAEDLGDLKKYLKTAYTVFAPGGDIFSYFYEKSFNILSIQGVFCFINNAFDKTTAGKALREYVANNCSLQKYIDLKTVGVFEGTTTYPIILLATKSKPQETFEYLKALEDTFSGLNLNGELVYTVLSRSSLSQYSWSFDSQGQAALLKKISKYEKLRKVFGKCYRGIITGINDAFVTERDLENNNHLKPVFEGKDIKKWLTPAISKKMIVFKNKSTRMIYIGRDEAKAFETMRKVFPMMMKHLLVIIKKIPKLISMVPCR